MVGVILLVLILRKVFFIRDVNFGFFRNLVELEVLKRIVYFWLFLVLFDNDSMISIVE